MIDVSLLEIVLDHGVALKKTRSSPCWKGYCPFCEDQPFSSFPFKNAKGAIFFKLNSKTQTFHCTSCKANGNAIEFIRNFHKIDPQEALNYLIDKYEDRVRND